VSNSLNNGEPAAYLVPGKSPYIVAYFQGQNIAEDHWRGMGEYG
jgi:hypothetical protein